MVSVTAKKYHTLNGAAYDAGCTYDVEDDQVDNLVNQGMVSVPDAPPAEPNASQPVEPMTTDDLPYTKGPS